jgi:hypothetical protein
MSYSKDHDVKRLRVLLLAILAIAAIVQASSSSSAQNIPAYITLPKTSGTVGTFTVSNPGVRCATESAAPEQLTVTTTGPVAKLANGMSTGRVDWTPVVYQVLTDARGFQPVRQGATQSLTLSANNTTAFQSTLFEHLPGGNYYAGGGTLTWYTSNATVMGTYSFRFDRYELIHDSRRDTSSANCNRSAQPSLFLSSLRTTVDTVISLQGSNFPISQPVKITWRGGVVGTVTSDAQGNVSGAFKIPAAPMGDYPLGLDGGPNWKVASAVTIVPRVKVLPGSAGRGETVKVSLRGFAKGETVRVRWKKGNGWAELGRVTMSSTGSGELWVPVPIWVPDGASSVRGDGTVGRAQTNAVFISGGAGFSTAGEKTPTPSPTATATATATATMTATIPASPEISPTISPTSTEITVTITVEPSETATETVTLTPTETATETSTPTIEPTIPPTEVSIPIETATVPTP